jgi:hypothetical protein
MVEKMAEKGLSGLSRCFRGAISSFCKEGNLLFVGSPFTCLPFAEFLYYGIRDLPLKCYFMPGTDIAKITQLTPREGFGYQLDLQKAREHKQEEKNEFDIVVLLGGLAMPKSQVSPKILKEQLLKVSSLDFVVALFFQGIMRKPEWLEEFRFKYIVDADISKVVLEEPQ